MRCEICGEYANAQELLRSYRDHHVAHVACIDAANTAPPCGVCDKPATKTGLCREHLKQYRRLRHVYNDTQSRPLFAAAITQAAIRMLDQIARDGEEVIERRRRELLAATETKETE